MGGDLVDERNRGYAATLGPGCVPCAANSSCPCRTSRPCPTTSSGRRYWVPTSAVSAPSRCRGSSAWPAATGSPSTRWCRATTSPPAARPPATPGSSIAQPTQGGPQYDDRPVTIDLAAVEQLAGPEGDRLARYLRAIEVQRGDYNGRVLTIRRHDLTAMACIFGCRRAGARPARRPGRPPRPLTRRRSRRSSYRRALATSGACRVTECEPVEYESSPAVSRPRRDG